MERTRSIRNFHGKARVAELTKRIFVVTAARPTTPFQSIKDVESDMRGFSQAYSKIKNHLKHNASAAAKKAQSRASGEFSCELSGEIVGLSVKECSAKGLPIGSTHACDGRSFGTIWELIKHYAAHLMPGGKACPKAMAIATKMAKKGE